MTPCGEHPPITLLGALTRGGTSNKGSLGPRVGRGCAAEIPSRHRTFPSKIQGADGFRSEFLIDRNRYNSAWEAGTGPAVHRSSPRRVRSKSLDKDQGADGHARYKDLRSDSTLGGIMVVVPAARLPSISSVVPRIAVRRAFSRCTPWRSSRQS